MTTIYIDAAPLFVPVLLSVAAVLVASTIGLAWLAWRDRPRAQPARVRTLHGVRSPLSAGAH